MKISFYTTSQGRRPVQRYIDSLERDEAAVVLAAFQDLALRGLKGSTVEMRHIDGKLYELKITRHRVFYVLLDGPEMVLLHAYKKQGQKAPLKEIDTAEKRMKEVLAGR